MKAENALKPGDVELTKVDDIDGTALEGAVFKIVDANDEKKVIRENVKLVRMVKLSLLAYALVIINLSK